MNIYHWMDQVGLDNVLKLTARMCKINNAFIQFSADKYYDRFSSSNSEPKMTKFFRLVESLKGNRKLYCGANFFDFRPNDVSISVKDDDNSMPFAYGLDQEDYGENPLLKMMKTTSQRR